MGNQAGHIYVLLRYASCQWEEEFTVTWFLFEDSGQSAL